MIKNSERKIVALVKSGASNAEIASVINGILTAAEVKLANKARVLFRIKKQQDRKTGTEVQQRANLRSNARNLICPTPSEKSKARRKRLEKDDAKWLRYYFPGVYRRPFGIVHHEIIAETKYTIKSGGKLCLAASRGTGKSVLVSGVALKSVLCEEVRFPVVMPWKSTDLKKILKFWKIALCFNPKLAEDYPEWCYPFVHCKGSAQKCLTLTDENGDPIGARLLISEGMIVLPHSKGVIGGATTNGNPLGLFHTTDAGEVLRPDLILIDDPQDRDTSKSASQIQNVIDLIDKDVSGMAGPDSSMSMVIICTVKAQGDVADHYLTVGGDWRSVRVEQILSWPTDFDDKASERRKLWEEWNEIRLEGEDNKDEGKAGIQFYNDNKDELVAGMAVSWDHRFKKKEPDGLFSAMLDYYKMGHNAFYAERQNDPQEAVSSMYELTAEMVCAHANDIRPLDIPPDSSFLVGFADINRVGLHWCMGGFSQDMTAHVPAYGKWPRGKEDLWEENATEQEIQKAIFTGLKQLCDNIEATQWMQNDEPRKVDLIMIDRGYKPDAVHRFCDQAKYSFKVIPSLGRSHSKYKVTKSSLKGRPMDGCHVTKGRKGNFVFFNSDKWREVSQRAFLGATGAAGGCTLYRVSSPVAHGPFADHVVSERLIVKVMSEIGWVYKWMLMPGTHNDLGDALTGCWVAAAACGLCVGGEPVVVKKAALRRNRVRHIKV